MVRFSYAHPFINKTIYKLNQRSIVIVMRSDKLHAYKLRASGRSYTEIVRLLGVPKSTLSNWFSGVVLSDEAKTRINERGQKKSVDALIKRNILQTHEAQKRAYQTRNNAKQNIGKISGRDLFLIGVALYWAEGYKKPMVRNGRIITSHYVGFTNSDPLLIALFLRFIREICEVPEEKIKANLRIFEHQNETYLLDFWQKTSRISISKFGKVYKGVSISSQGKKPYNILPYGTFQVRISDTPLYHKIMGWIDGLADIKK